MGSDAARAEWRRRTALDPADAERWRDLADETAGKPLAEQLPNLLGWNAAAPDDPVPARRLSAEYVKVEAASELLRYFPLRLRYAGACGASPDRGLLMLLLANYDLPRLRVYLDERAAAIEWYRAHLHNPRPDEDGSLPSLIARRRHYEPLRCLVEPLPPPVEAPVLAACVPVATNEYLSRGGADAAPAGERKRRLREATAAMPCPAGWPSDLEPLFEDERLLSSLG